jgi:hypothetical protein
MKILIKGYRREIHSPLTACALLRKLSLLMETKIQIKPCQCNYFVNNCNNSSYNTKGRRLYYRNNIAPEEKVWAEGL